jgi:hypothetical protein
MLNICGQGSTTIWIAASHRLFTTAAQDRQDHYGVRGLRGTQEGQGINMYMAVDSNKEGRGIRHDKA